MAENRGGRRKGAGRKVGSVSNTTAQVAKEAMSKNITPIEVLLDLMVKAHKRGDEDQAGKWADKAAPYCHPRLSSVDSTGDNNVTVNLTTNFPLDDDEY